jgi:hypothetical protein
MGNPIIPLLDTLFNSGGNEYDKGFIFIPSDFPTLAAVQVGWQYIIASATVTDNDITRTDTGQTFTQGQQIKWNGHNWTVVASDILWGTDGVNLFPLASLGLKIPTLSTSNGIVTTSSAGLFATSTALPNGTTATTQAAADNSTKLATTAYVDTAVGVENLWDRADLGAGNWVLYPHTSGDKAQLPYITATTGAILFGDAAGNKTISASQYLFWTGTGLINVSSTPYFKANMAGNDGASGLVWENLGDGSSQIYHNNQLGNSVLYIDAKTATTGTSLVNFGANTTASSMNFDFYGNVNSRASFISKAYTTTTLDATMTVDVNPVNHVIGRLSFQNLVGTPAYIDIDVDGMAGSSSYLRLFYNSGATNKYLYNYALQRNIRTGAAGAELTLLEIWNENTLPLSTDLTNTSSSFLAMQRRSSAGMVSLGKLFWKCEGSFAGDPATTEMSGVHLQIVNGGALVDGLYVDSLKKSYLYNLETISFSGTLGAATPFLTLANTVYNASMAGTGTQILNTQKASDGVAYNCGAISWECETNWTATASTRNSTARIQAVINGTLTTVALLSPSQGLYFYHPMYSTASITSSAGDFIATAGGYYIGTPSSSVIGSWHQCKTGTVLRTTYKIQHYEDVSGDGSAYGYVDKLTIDYLGNVSTLSSLSGLYGSFSAGTTIAQNAAAVNSPTLSVINTANRSTLTITGNTAGEGTDKISGNIHFHDSNISGNDAYISWQSGLTGKPISFFNGGSRVMQIFDTGNVDIYTDGAIAALTLTQLNISRGLINFVASDRGAIVLPVSSVASVRGELNGVVYRIALFADA